MGVCPQTTEIDALVYMWGGKILRDVWQIQRYISETAQNRDAVTMGDLWEVMCWSIKWDIADDLE